MRISDIGPLGPFRAAALAVVAASSAASAQQLTLDGLCALARERADRLRPKLEEKLAPFATDLMRPYRDDPTRLDARFDEIAQLGPEVLPLLLEYLTPTDTSPEQAQRAGNAARVIERIGVDHCVGALLELQRSDSSAARRHALGLLGLARGSEAAGRGLAQGLTARPEPEQLAAIRSLDRLDSPHGIEPAMALLGTGTPRVRDAALRYLTRIDKVGDLMPRLTAAFRAETVDDLKAVYVRYLVRHAEREEALATDLLELARTPRLPAGDRDLLVRALGRIAPPDHRPTIEVLEQIVETGHVGRLEQSAALALRDLGEKSGIKTISSRHDKSVKKRRNDPDALQTRGAWNMALEEWRDAARDFEDAIELSRSSADKAELWLVVARCEAHRGKISKVKSALRDSGMSRDKILSVAAADPVFEAFLSEKDSLQRFLRSLD